MTYEEAIQRLNIHVDLIPKGSNNRPGEITTPTFVTIHDTANTDPGTDAAWHARYVKGPEARKREVSWHFSVDDRQVYKHLPTNEVAWHAGPANKRSVAIEICVNRDGNQGKARDRAALLAAVMMHNYNIPIERLVTHQSWTGKYCPRSVLNAEGGFGAFRERARGYLEALRSGREEGTPLADRSLLSPAEPEEGSDAPPVAELEGFSGVDPLDEATAVPDAVEPDEAVRLSQMERLLGRLALENHTLREALEEARRAATTSEAEAD